jgi:hypothetical protein
MYKTKARLTDVLLAVEAGGLILNSVQRMKTPLLNQTAMITFHIRRIVFEARPIGPENDFEVVGIERRNAPSHSLPYVLTNLLDVDDNLGREQFIPAFDLALTFDGYQHLTAKTFLVFGGAVIVSAVVTFERNRSEAKLFHMTIGHVIEDCVRCPNGHQGRCPETNIWSCFHGSSISEVHLGVIPTWLLFQQQSIHITYVCRLLLKTKISKNCYHYMIAYPNIFVKCSISWTSSELWIGQISVTNLSFYKHSALNFLNSTSLDAPIKDRSNMQRFPRQEQSQSFHTHA